jgi:hypothetical protein
LGWRAVLFQLVEMGANILFLFLCDGGRRRGPNAVLTGVPDPPLPFVNHADKNFHLAVPTPVA